MEGLDEDLIILIKKHKLNWPSISTDDPGILADQLLKTIQKIKRDKAAKIVNVQLTQLSNQARSLRRPQDVGGATGEERGMEKRSLFLLQKAMSP